jgi:hypothetical protein
LLTAQNPAGLSAYILQLTGTNEPVVHTFFCCPRPGLLSMEGRCRRHVQLTPSDAKRVTLDFFFLDKATGGLAA